MTIATTASTTTLLGNGATTSFVFNFIADSEEFIEVIYTDSDNVQTTLPTSSYTLVINAPAAGQIWGIGGTVTYPLSGSPIATGTSLTISRVLPYTQVISISNQGDFAPQVIEEMGDTLEMQIQQVVARTTQFRGTWITNVDYFIGDIVQDGANGSDTHNYYICTIANTSSIWSDDLAAGDWALSVAAIVPTSNLPITLSGAVYGTGQSSIVTNLGTSVVATSNIANLAVTTGKIADANVTLAKISNASASSRLLGSGTSAVLSSYTEISLGTNLSMSGTTLNAASVFTASYTSSDQTITSAGTLTLTHNLGSAPQFIAFELVCQSNDGNYTTGQIVPISQQGGQPNNTGGAASAGVSAITSSTNIVLRFGSAVAAFQIINATNGNALNIDNTKWKLRVKAWA